MRAVMCRDWSEPSGLSVEEIAAPEPGAGEVRIAVHAAGLNFADTLIIQGKYQERPDLPFTPGMECAGEVEKLGPGVSGLKEGDRVMAITGQGAFAERVVAPAATVMKIPASMGYDMAAAFPVAYGTSHIGLRHRAGLQSDEVLLVHGAAGGVGLTAVQIGTVIGANVIGTARGKDKLSIAQANGANHVIDYGEEDVRERVKAITDGRGADVVYDPVGGDVFDQSLRCMAWEGRLLVVGFASGKIPQAPANYILVKNISVVGLYWGAYLKRDPDVIRRSFDELLGWFDDGLLSPHVSRTYDLEETPAAMERMLTRKSVGKVVLTTGVTRPG